MQVHAGHLGHHQVRDHQVELRARDRLQRGASGLHDDHLVLPRERPPHGARDQRIVLDKKDAAAPRLAGRRRRRRLGRFARGGGERHAERASPPWRALRLDAAAERGHDPVADGQPEPGTRPDRPRGEERIEDAGQHLGGHARAGVAHFEHHLAAPPGPHGDAHFVAVRLALRDRLGGVQDQVHQHLPEVRLARLDQRRGLEVPHHPRAVAQLVREQVQHLLRHLRHVEGPAPLVEPAREDLQPAHDLRHPVRAPVRLGHRFEQVAGVGGVRQRLGQLLPEQVEVREHRSERIVDLVRQPSREGAHGGHPLGEDELRLEPGALLFRRALRPGVAQDKQRAGHRSRLVAQRHRGVDHRVLRASLGDQQGVRARAARDRLAPQRTGDQVVERAAVLRGDDAYHLGERLSLRFGRRRPAERLGARAQPRHPACAVDYDQRVPQAVDEPFQVLLAVAHRGARQSVGLAPTDAHPPGTLWWSNWSQASQAAAPSRAPAPQRGQRISCAQYKALV